MAEANRAGIATLVMHGKEHLAAIRPSGPVLLLETLFFADEVRDPKEMLEHLPGAVAFTKGELAMATQLITAMDEAWAPSRYTDTYSDQVNELIAATRQGHQEQEAAAPPAATNVVDLVDALRRSVASARRPATTTAPVRAAAKKAPTKKAPGEKAPARKAPAGKARKAPAKRAPDKRAPAKKDAGGANRHARTAS